MSSTETTAEDDPQAYEVSTCTNFDALAALAAEWRAADAGKDLYSTWDWFENLSLNGIEPEFTRLLVVARHRVTGSSICLPLLRRPRSPAAVYGSVVSGLSNYYSSLYGPVGDSRGVTLGALRAIVAHLKRQQRPAAVIDIQPLDQGDPFYGLLIQALRAEGYVADSYFCFGNWHLQVAGRSFAEYEPSLPSRLRNTYRRGRKKLDGSGPWSLQVHAQAGPALEAAIVDFETIYGKSWKTAEPFPRFIGGVCRAAAARGWLRLGVIRAEDKPIAAQLWFVKDRRALIFKLAYDEEYKRFSAGSVLSAEMMRQALDEDGVDDVDYLTGDDAYKVDWMSHRRERMGVVAFLPSRPQGLLSLLRHLLGRLRRRKPPAPAPADGTDGAEGQPVVQESS